MKQSDYTVGGGHTNNATKHPSSRLRAGSGCARPKKDMKRMNTHIPRDEYTELCTELDALPPKQAVKLLLKYAEVGRLACAEHKQRRGDDMQFSQ